MDADGVVRLLLITALVGRDGLEGGVATLLAVSDSALIAEVGVVVADLLGLRVERGVRVGSGLVARRLHALVERDLGGVLVLISDVQGGQPLAVALADGRVEVGLFQRCR